MIKMNRTNVFNQLDAPVPAAKNRNFLNDSAVIFWCRPPVWDCGIWPRGAGPPAAVMKMIMLKACYFFEPVLWLQGDEAVWRSPKITAPLVRQDYPSWLCSIAQPFLPAPSEKSETADVSWDFFKKSLISPSKTICCIFLQEHSEKLVFIIKMKINSTNGASTTRPEIWFGMDERILYLLSQI